MKTLFNEEELRGLQCYHCGKSLLNPPTGHLLMKDEWKGDKQIISDIRWVCCSCDNNGIYKRWGWKDLPDLFIPEVLIQWILGIMVSLHNKTAEWSDETMENLMKLLLIIFPHVSKEITTEQKKTLESLHWIPRCLGGLGG